MITYILLLFYTTLFFLRDSNEVTSITETTSFSSSSPSKSKIVVVQESAVAQKQHANNIPEITVSQPQNQINKVASTQPPGIIINQLMCTDVPGDEPIVQLIDILEPLKIPSSTLVTKKGNLFKLQVTNNSCATSKGSLARIEVFKQLDDKQSLWDTYLGSSIRCIQNSRKYIVACCEDLSINFYHIKSGARVLPQMLIEDAVSALCLSDNSVCLVLTKTGLIHMWNIEIGKSLLNRVSIRSLLSNKASVSTCSLTTSDLPLLTLSDGRAYTYSLDLQTW